MVINLHIQALVIARFLFFMVFVTPIQMDHDDVSLKSPILVGFFGWLGDFWRVARVMDFSDTQKFKKVSVVCRIDDFDCI
jgi:hypothetical protein